jgi:hypothetical protein
MDAVVSGHSPPEASRWMSRKMGVKNGSARLSVVDGILAGQPDAALDGEA